MDKESYIVDTPGFSSMFVPGMTKEKLQDCFPEMAQYEPECKFGGCAHINEPICGVKEAVNSGNECRRSERLISYFIKN